MVAVREVSPDDWETFREIRLAALREAPNAFASTYAQEAPLAPEQWRGRIGARSLPAVPAPAGLVGVYEEDGIADVISMWVRPSARGQRVGEALISATADWAKVHDHDALFLWVTESNEPARRLYQRYGFSPTGDRQPLPSNPDLSEIRMRRPL
jgi:GNAT superfamily N-acetyltransferase